MSRSQWTTKLKVTRLLDDLGVMYIEGGWPGSNPKDATYFERVRELELKHAKIAAFSMTCRVGGDPADDANIRALLDAQTPVVTVVGKTSLLHVRDVLRTTPERKPAHYPREPGLSQGAGPRSDL